jgi:hypothetical protein
MITPLKFDPAVNAKGGMACEIYKYRDIEILD